MIRTKAAISCLVVNSGISQNKKSWFSKAGLELISEGSGGMSSGNSHSTSVLSELQNSPLSIGSGRLDVDVLGVFNCDDHSGSQKELLVSLGQINDVNACPKN